jgi:hypothetical protein
MALTDSGDEGMKMIGDPEIGGGQAGGARGSPLFIGYLAPGRPRPMAWAIVARFCSNTSAAV